MKAIFREFKPEIISSHINEGAWMAGMVARQACPEACVVRTRGDIDPPKGHFINRFVHHVWTDHIIVSSLLHKRICHDILDFPTEKIDIVYGAIDSDLFKPRPPETMNFRREIQVGPDVALIGMVARLDPVKGHEYALQALKMLGSCPVKRKLVVLGYENQRTFAWLKALAAELGVADQVVAFGFRDDLPEVLSACDVGLITSIGSEANCRAALEFMASGKPVVGTSVGVIPEIVIEGEQGILVPPKDSVGLATALSRLLTNPVLRHTLGKNGREHVLKNFHLSLFTQRTEKVYKKAFAARNPAR